MGTTHSHAPVARLAAVITRHAEALQWARERMAREWGDVALVSPTFDFSETDYYAAAMGTGLTKTFLMFQSLANPADLADWKHRTNQWETDCAALGRWPEARPVNIDPGYLTPAKLVLASTKDHAHRVYLRDGMFAEVTLYYRDGCWHPREWTFPDYRRADFQAFFDEVRRWLRAAKPALP
jgi:hypothetical protein